MAAHRAVALLRGINVGGRNRVAMADLRAAFDDAGYGCVRTYIQSGNVVFSAEGSSHRLEDDIEDLLSRRLGMRPVVVVRSREQMHRVVADAPDGFTSAAGEYLCDVVFLKSGLTAHEARQAVSLRDGVDEAWPGDGVLYFRRLAARRSQSRMSAIVARPEYQKMTIRNWTTTTRLLTMLDEVAPPGG